MVHVSINLVSFFREIRLQGKKRIFEGQDDIEHDAWQRINHWITLWLNASNEAFQGILYFIFN